MGQRVRHGSHPLVCLIASRVGQCLVMEVNVLFSSWIKFEEDVEEGGHRWSKPHVAALSLHSLLELRSLLLRAVLLFDLEATTLEQVADLAIEALIQAGQLPDAEVDKVSHKSITHLLKKKRQHREIFIHQHIRV